jgi:hypothetical protein
VGRLGDGGYDGWFWLDKANGNGYEEMRADPLLSEKPSEHPVSLFILAGGAIRVSSATSIRPTARSR